MVWHKSLVYKLVLDILIKLLYNIINMKMNDNIKSQLKTNPENFAVQVITVGDLHGGLSERKFDTLTDALKFYPALKPLEDGDVFLKAKFIGYTDRTKWGFSKKLLYFESRGAHKVLSE
jgi:hypothetical protein